MEKNFVTYKIALALKELDFNEPCFGIWIERGTKVDVIYVAKQDDSWMAEQNDGILAPLWQQSIDFCLKQLELSNPESYNRRWRIEYYADGDGGIDFGEGDYYYEFKTMEDAVLKFIELIKKRKI